MKNFAILLLLMMFSLILACESGIDHKNEKIEIPPVKSGAFYTDVADSGQSIILAPSIIYDVIIKNPDSADYWTDECLQELDIEAMSNIIFNAIYNGKLVPHDYNTESPISLKEVKEFETEYLRKRIGKMQFSEEWYFNETSMEFGKRVNAIMLAYELYENDSTVKGYKAGIKVYLNKKTTKEL